MTINKNIANFTYTNLTSPPSEEDCYDELKEVLIDIVPSISNADLTDLSAGSFIDSMLHVAARIHKVGVDDTAALAATQFAGNSVGDSLTTVAMGFYDEPRNLGKPTIGYFKYVYSNTNVGPFTIEPGELQIEELNGVVFSNTSGFTINTSTPVGSFEVQCTQSGTIGNIANNSTLRAQNTFVGVDFSNPVYSGNTWITSYGTDTEADDRLARRCTTKFATLAHSEVIKDDLEHDILNVSPSIKYVNIDDLNPRGAGTVDVYISNDLGVAPLGDIELVQSGVLDNRFYGNGASGDNRVQCHSAIGVELPVSGTIFYKGDLNTVQNRCDEALKGLISSYTIGGNKYPEIFANTGVVFFSDFEEVLNNVPNVEALQLDRDITQISDGKFEIGPNEKPVYPQNGYIIRPQTLLSGSLTFTRIKLR